MDRSAGWLLAPPLLAALTYIGAWQGCLFWDDHLLAGEFERTLHRGGWWAVAFHPFLGEYFRPLTALTLAAELRGGPGSAAVAHLSNVVWHVLACTFVGLWLRTEGLPARAAGLAAALFAVLPLGSEAVLWISSRGDLIVGAFAALALTATARVFPLAGEEEADRPPWVAMAAIPLATLGALAGKELGLAVALALVVRILWPSLCRRGGVQRRRGAVLAAAVTAVVVAYLGVRAAVIPPLGDPDLALAPALGGRAALFLRTVGAMLARAGWPWTPDLAIGVMEIPSGMSPGSILGAVGLTVAIALGLGASRWPRVGLAAVLFVVLALPTTNLIPLQIATLTADRYLYVPWLAAALALALGLAWLGRAAAASTAARAVALGLPLVLVAAGGTRTIGRVRTWADEEQLLRALAAEADPGNGQPALVLGAWLADRGRCSDATAPLNRALDDLERQGRAVGVATALSRLSACAMAEADYDAAVELAGRAVAVAPGRVEVHLDLARALGAAGRFEESAAIAAEATSRFPHAAGPAAELSRTLAALLRFEESAVALADARARAGLEGESALLLRLRDAAGRAADANARVADGDAGGLLILADLADEYGNPALAVELREQAGEQAKREVGEGTQ